MSQLTALLLAGIITSQAFYNAGVLGYWLANRAYIASVLCENRARPMLHCDGKCYLKKHLAAADPVSGDHEQLPVLKKGLDLAECPFRPVLPRFSSPEDAAPGLPSGEGRCATGFPYAVFRPPSGAA